MSEHVAIPHEHAAVIPPAKKIDASRMIAIAIKEAFSGRYARSIAYAVGVKRTTVAAWFCNTYPPRRIPLKHERTMLAHFDRTIEGLQRARTLVAADIAERERQPRRLRGMLAVRDHGDGLPPHNQQGPTLAKLGLIDISRLGRPLKSKP